MSGAGIGDIASGANVAIDANDASGAGIEDIASGANVAINAKVAIDAGVERGANVKGNANLASGLTPMRHSKAARFGSPSNPPLDSKENS